ncbi:hypothetical protein IW150_001340 [Coemansia sp. RSA 2607]|nr:hypothetical protein IW150_001340 [Coemansia sp. RSA 2607]
MYQSAYLKLISGPAEVLRRLNPPVELGSIIDTTTNADVASSESLLKILKALTKGQAKQLASMYDREAGVGRNPLDLSMRSIRPSPRSSLPSSREVSPSPDVDSGAEQEGYLHTPTAGNGTYSQQKRKYIKTGKYSVKKRKDAPDTAESSATTPTTPRPPPLRKTPTSNYIHPELVRKGLKTLSERRRAPDQISYETEISKRFQEALAMDHRMVGEVDWHTPFSGTQDVIQRLLPYHIFQYPDTAIDAITNREEEKIEKSTDALSKRLQKLSERFNGILTREGSDSYYSIDRMQLDRLRKDDFKQQKDQLKDLQLQRDISSLGSALGSYKDRTF